METAAVEFTSRLGDDFEGFFGANLYLQAFASDGQQVEIEVNGKEKIITLSLPAGEALRPALSEEVKVKHITAKKAATERQLQVAKEREAERRQWEAERSLKQAKLRASEAEQARREQEFSKLVSLHGNDFIGRCNEVIVEVWREWCPVWPHGQRKGEPRPTPHLDLVDGVVHLLSGPNSARRKVRTPLSQGTNYRGDLEPYWKHAAWVDGAIPKLQALMESCEGHNSKDEEPISP